MSELKDLLERSASDFEPPPSGWDRFLRRARRRRAHRRMTAGVVASAVASAGIGMVLIAFGGTKNPQPAAAPVENKIAFSSYRDGRLMDIYLMNRDGTGVIRVTDSAAEDHQPTWSPDGTKIAFSSTRSGGSSHTRGDIFVMNGD